MSISKAMPRRQRVPGERWLAEGITWPVGKTGQQAGKPQRRVSVPGKDNRSIYARVDGKLEIGYRDSFGKQRWRVVEGGITAARAERDKLLGAKAKGERLQPNPRLRFGEAADRWLADQVTDLRPATQAIYRNAIEIHLRAPMGRPQARRDHDR